MRDELGRSRGYGFVSFVTPEEGVSYYMVLELISAAHAITCMNGATVGSQSIAVTLHEPRKLRPEKIAERLASGLPLVSPHRTARSSASPVRFDRSALSRRRDPIIENVSDHILYDIDKKATCSNDR